MNNLNEWDEADKYAEAFHKWQQFSAENNLSKRNRLNYIPNCRKCRGRGAILVDKLTYETQECDRCFGTGLEKPRQKFDNAEIKNIVRKLGPEKVQQIIKKFYDKK